MVRLDVEGVTLDYPVLDPSSRLLKTRVARSLGGLMHQERGQPLSVRALDGVSFNLVAGDRLGIIGRNGAGKTTLLRVLSRIYEPSAGAVLTRGTLTSFLDLTAGLDVDATGHENIELRASLSGWDKETVARALQYVAEISGLGRFLYLPLRTYSAGMLMRLAFGIATARPADILIMDEWLAVGDSEHLRTAEQRIAELVNAAGILVLASHSPVFIEKWCTRLLVLDAGRVAFLGDVKAGLAAHTI
jgi:lipopolysaccharide transport system ATP-binding protein